MLNLDVAKEIEKMKQKMYCYINKYGLNDIKTVKISQEIDKMLMKIYVRDEF